ncbi:hypothetical protein [Nocardia inohanensis]|uniref:hypothetical protein n=1 Tax=Nocardia inohanensis TaxID=209246 RepID=UPI000AE15C90|nr:hypothetical protein [Nocardia inohanensis]
MTARTAKRVGAIVSAAGAALALGMGVAHAGEWPEQQPNSPISVFETKNFLTPDNPGYWNPFDFGNRLTSPYGTSTRIVCNSFHGVTMSCWQADQDGNPHQLQKLPFNFPALPGYGRLDGGSNFVYPGYIPGVS